MYIGLFLKNLDEEYQREIYRGVKEAAKKIGVNLVCIQGESFEIKQEIQDSFFAAGNLLPLDGALILSSILIEEENLSNRNYLLEKFSGMPLVSIGKKIGGCTSLIVNVKESLSALMNHLIETHQYSHFLYIGGPENHPDNMDREKRIKEVVENKVGYSLTVLNNSIFSEQSGTASIQKYIEQRPKRDVDVIICGSDDIAVGVLKYLKTQSETSWENCPLTGFDDIPRGRIINPPLTTIHQPLAELGKDAVRLLYSKIKGSNPNLCNSVDASLVVRRSCGCPYCSDNNIEEVDLRWQENLLPDVSRLGQALMMAESYNQIEETLRVFLGLLAVKEYYLVCFSRPTSEFPQEGILLSKEPRRGNIKEFVDEYFDSNVVLGEESSFLHLCFGEEQLGFILYKSNEALHLIMSCVGIFLSNTLKKVQISEEERGRSRELEILVKERTEALSKESERRVEVEKEVLKISELERMRFSVDLHDDICQRLAAIAMLSQNEFILNPSSNIEKIAKMACDTLKQTKQYSRNSFPIELEKIGLIDALSQLCQNYSEDYDFFCLFLFSESPDLSLTKREEINLYRIVQEALQNVVAHSKATEAEVSIVLENNKFILRVKDNGIGNVNITDVNLPLTRRRRPCGLGLKSMEYRANQLNAKFYIRSSKQTGTTIEVVIPLDRKD